MIYFRSDLFFISSSSWSPFVVKTNFQSNIIFFSQRLIQEWFLRQFDQLMQFILGAKNNYFPSGFADFFHVTYWLKYNFFCCCWELFQNKWFWFISCGVEKLIDDRYARFFVHDRMHQVVNGKVDYGFLQCSREMNFQNKCSVVWTIRL